MVRPSGEGAAAALVASWTAMRLVSPSAADASPASAAPEARPAKWTPSHSEPAPTAAVPLCLMRFLRESSKAVPLGSM
jgi:hypothetical protein